jgi:uncharacterized SAM-binding protein YcdF (DUF218 family)
MTGAPPTAPERKRRRRRALAVLVLAAALAVAALYTQATVIDRYGSIDRARPADAVVILGCRVGPGGVPSDSLRARTLHAVELYKRGLAPAIVCTGGLGTNPPEESRVEAELALRRGVPASALFRENRSHSTLENARFAAEICRAHGWKRVIVVSEPYHLYRAAACFRRVGLDPYPSPARNSYVSQNPWMRTVQLTREALLLLRDAILPS